MSTTSIRIVINRGCYFTWRRFGFTLIEVLSVIAIIGIFVGVIGLAFRGGGDSTVGLQASQSTIVSMVTLVRGQAAVSGRNAALFVCVDSANRPERILRYLVPVVRNEVGNAWIPLSDGVFLPVGCYVVPFVAPSGTAVEDGTTWTGLNSSRLFSAETLTLNAGDSDDWIGVAFNSRGNPTPAVGGGLGPNIVVANGQRQPPGTDPPFKFVNPNNIRGVAVSIYGMITLVDDASGFN